MAGETILNIQELLKTVFMGYATRLIVAIIILLFGFIIGRIVGKLIEKVLHELELNLIIKKTLKLKIPFEQTTAQIIMYLIYFVTIIMALNQLGLATDILNIILGGFVVIIVLTIFLSIKDFVPNLISGIFIHQKQFIRVGDFIRVNNIEGTITTISMVDTLVMTKNGDIIYIPNSILTKSEVILISRKKK